MTPSFSSGRSLRSAHLRRAFTILELLVVLAIIGLLAGLVLTRVGDNIDKASIKTVSLFVKQAIDLPLTSYRIDMGSFPTTTEGLQVLVAAPASRADRWQGPYLKEDTVPLDPFGEPYQYRFPGVKNKTGYDVWSKGPDKQDGTADDIGNWSSPAPAAK